MLLRLEALEGARDVLTHRFDSVHQVEGFVDLVDEPIHFVELPFPLARTVDARRALSGVRAAYFMTSICSRFKCLPSWTLLPSAGARIWIPSSRARWQNE